MFWIQYKPRPRALLPIIAVIFASSAGLIILKIFFKQGDEKGDKKNKNLKLPNKRYKPTLCIDELAIPRNSVGAVIGRRGLKIKYIENITRTSVIFHDKSDDETNVSCVINGTSDKVKEARKLILQSIEEVPVLEYLEMNIPNFAVASVIKTIGFGSKDLSESIGANVCSVNKPNHTENGIIHIDSCSTRQIMIKGTLAQIKAAELAVKNIVEKEIELRKQVNSSIVNISQRNMVKHRFEESITDRSTHLRKMDEKEIMDSKFIEGIVSAFESPCHFWFQMKGPSIIRLNSLVEEMTSYYNVEVNRKIHKKVEIKYDDIVAAQFPHDKNWYRGCICKHEETDDPDKYVVYFVDFGDSDEVDPGKICELRTDFLQLNFQAVEAHLANIDPKSITPEAVEVFTELAYVNLCDSVKIRIIGYNTGTNIGIPHVQVISKNAEKEIDIAEELVRLGLAKRML